MGSARRLYRVGVTVAVLAITALVAATTLAWRSIDLRGLDAGAVLEACRDALLPALDGPSLAAAVLGSLSMAVLVLGTYSIVMQGRSRRRYLQSIDVVDVLDIDGVPVHLIDDERPQAFCAHLLLPRVYLSTGALITLEDDELRAVVAHEHHHQRRRDPLRLVMADATGDALFFLPVLGRLRERYAALAEMAADEAAITTMGTRAALASALLTFGEHSHPDVVVGIAPERVDHLLGQRAQWELPASMLLGALVTLGGLLAIGVATASSPSSAGMSLPFVLAQACALAMTAIPAIAGGTALAVSTRQLRAR